MVKEGKSIEEEEFEIDQGNKDKEVYSEAGRAKLKEDDEIEDWEEGFMEGAEGRGELNCCAECGKNLGEDKENIVEREFNGEIKWFCSEEHAENYAKKLEKKKKKLKL